MLRGRPRGQGGHDFVGGLLFEKGKGPLGAVPEKKEQTDRLARITDSGSVIT